MVCLRPFVTHGFRASHPSTDFQSVEIIREHAVSVNIEDSTINCFQKTVILLREELVDQGHPFLLRMSFHLSWLLLRKLLEPPFSGVERGSDNFLILQCNRLLFAGFTLFTQVQVHEHK